MKYKEHLQKIFGQIMNTRALVIIFIVGIGLMLLPQEKDKGERVSSTKTDCGTAYKTEMEKQLKTILSSVKGVGSTEVMITLENDGQTFFASDVKAEYQKRDDTEQNTEEKTYLLKNDAGGGESPIVVQQGKPNISGVLVIAEGAKQADVKNDIIRAVRAVLGVKAHRIEVLERK